MVAVVLLPCTYSMHLTFPPHSATSFEPTILSIAQSPPFTKIWGLILCSCIIMLSCLISACGQKGPLIPPPHAVLEPLPETTPGNPNGAY